MTVTKKAILVNENVFQQAEEVARSLKVSRSHAVALALEEYLRRQENLALLERINATCDDTADPEEDKHLRAAQRSFLKVADKW